MESDAEPAGASASAWLAPFRLTVAGGPHAPAAARAALTDWLTGHLPEGELDDARLLVSELVTNCVQHGRLAPDATLRIEARFAARVLRIEVRNPGHDGSVGRREPDPAGSGGYGLHLLDLLATRWGVDRAAGTEVWCELASTAS